MARQEETEERGSRLGRTAAVIALTVAVAVPVTAYAADTFNDVPNSNVFHDDINWMADNGVTRGCNPPDNTEYCPDETVTREQMAAFMHRLETQGVFLTPNDDINAGALDGQDGTYYANPIAIAAGSTGEGTQVTSDGEVAQLTISAPAAGDVIARVTSSWNDNGNDYTAVMWIEPRNTGALCDNIADGDPLPGARGTTAVQGTQAVTSQTSLAGEGFDAGVSQGTHDYSLCLQTFGDGANIDWSGSVEWRADGVSTVTAGT